MGSPTIISVSFRCSENEDVAELARKHFIKLNESPAPDWEYTDRLSFLRDLSIRTGENRGSKGGLSQWSTVGRSLDVKTFVQELSGFWSDLLATEVEGGPSNMYKIVVLYEHEDAGGACCFEIGFAEEDQGPLADFLCEHGRPPDPSIPGETRPPLQIKHYQLPFTWGM